MAGPLCILVAMILAIAALVAAIRNNDVFVGSIAAAGALAFLVAGLLAMMTVPTS